MGVRLTNYHCIIDARDPVAAEPTDKCKTAQSRVYREYDQSATVFSLFFTILDTWHDPVLRTKCFMTKTSNQIIANI